MANDTLLAQAETATGMDNPTLGYNLDGFSDFAPVMQFLDITKSMRRWEANLEGQSGGMSYEELKDGGYLDAQGWVKEIPEGASSISTLWQWKNRSELGLAEDVRGTYILEYEGTGEIVLGGDARIISSEPGRIVFENVEGKHLYMAVTETDPAGTGDYMRNISIVAEKHKDLYDAGAVYNPAWLELIQDARELRFLSWSGANNSELTSWDERGTPDGMAWGVGVSVEEMVQLANEVGADPWFVMPHLADENYIRKFAEYVRDNLDPNLKAKVEYSNETWNWAFDQTDWLHAQSVAEWGVAAHNEYYAKKAVETALIWEDVFGDEADARLINVIATQTSNPGVTSKILNPVKWRENEPDSYVDPADVFEELAVTTYFGSKTVSDETLRNELIAAIKDPDVDAAAYLAEKLMDPSYRGSIPEIAGKLARQAELAEQYGMKLTSYEGGQHVHHTFSVRGLSNEDIAFLQDFMIDFVRSEEMGQLYREIWDVWMQYGDTAFMQFGDIGTPRKSGSWALYAGLEDETPRSLALEELNATTDAWWDGATGGEQYQQGMIVNGTAAGDLLVGTSQEDYLLGQDGDDILVAGAGNDGLNGGDGTDRAVFGGAMSDYVIRKEGEGIRVIGADGSDFLINMEELSFDDIQTVILDDMIDRGDGTLVLSGTDTPAPAPVPDPTPEPTPEPDPEDGPVRGKLKAGQIKDTSKLDAVQIDDFRGREAGLKITAFAGDSALGQSLNLDGNGNSVSYLSFAKGTGDPTEDLLSAPLRLQTEADPLEHGAIAINANKIIATSGDDTFLGLGGNDTVSGAEGDDVLKGLAGEDILRGNKGNDLLLGHSDNDILSGGQGSDSLYGERGDDKMHGGEDKDFLHGGKGNDKILGGKNGDSIYGEEGNDELHGQTGFDRIQGGDGADTIFGGEGEDRLIGGEGNDRILGGNHTDTLFGSKGDDTLLGGGHGDSLFGGDGNDIVRGQMGHDTLEGGEGNDYMVGGEGDDLLMGGLGDDILLGGIGDDQFSFAAGNGHDEIRDFTAGDSLQLLDFASTGQSLADLAGMEDGHLVLSNGSDKITLLNLDMDDLSWMNNDLP